MGRYIGWNDVTGRYRELGKEQGAEEVSSGYIFYGEQDVDGYLGGYYAAPFSTNNVTAKDLAIDFTYVRMSRRTKPKDAETMFNALMKRIEQLKSGAMVMVTTSGDQLRPELVGLDSTTIDYNPVFTLAAAELAHADSGQLYNEEATYD